MCPSQSVHIQLRHVMQNLPPLASTDLPIINGMMMRYVYSLKVQSGNNFLLVFILRLWLALNREIVAFSLQENLSLPVYNYIAKFATTSINRFTHHHCNDDDVCVQFESTKWEFLYILSIPRSIIPKGPSSKSAVWMCFVTEPWNKLGKFIWGQIWRRISIKLPLAWISEILRQPADSFKWGDQKGKSTYDR